MESVKAPICRKNVLVLNWRDPWHPEGGGSELFVQQVTERLAQTADVTLFTAAYDDAPARETRNGVTYVRRGNHLTVYLWAALFLLTRRFGRIDSVLEVQNGMPFLARLCTRRPVTVLVHHVHREQWHIVGPVLSRVGWFFESRVAPRVNRASRYVTVSAVSRDELVDLGVDRDRIDIAWNGAPPQPEFTPGEPTPWPSLVVLGRLVPHKQVEHALHTAAQLRGSFPGLRLTVMGSGWWHDKLAALATELELDDQVEFLGHVDDTTKFRVLSESWVHVLPSLKEGWGLSIIEAAQVGVPSVAYRSAGGTRDSILDGVTGLLATDLSDLVACTRSLLSDHALRTGLGAKAEVRTAEFTWEATTAVVSESLGLAAR